jgi:pullulanase/glycogen debranching enzyme
LKRADLELEEDQLGGQHSQLQNVSKFRLYGILKKFYHKMIVQKGFKKCTCGHCLKMAHPMLIRFNADSQQYFKAHIMMHE